MDVRKNDNGLKKWQLSRWQKGVPYGAAPALTLEQIRNIRQFLLERRHRQTGKRDLLIFDLLLNTGCYVGELYNLKMSDLVYETEEARIPVAKSAVIFKNSATNKSRNDRVVPVSRPLRDSIEANAEISREWVCWSQLRDREERMDKIYLTYMIHKWSKRCGAKIRAHSFRKTFMRRLFENGVDIPTMLKLSGHKSVQSLEQYFPVREAAASNDAIPVFDAVYSYDLPPVKHVS
jgi:integrase